MRDEREMKDSGIEWIEDIPINWKIAKIRNVIQPGKDGIKIGPFGSALTNKTSGDAEYKIYGQANLVSGDFSDTKNKISKEIFIELQNYEVIPGDICISMMGTIGKCLTVPYGISKGIMDSHLIKIRLKETVDNRFFEYVYDKDKGGICFTQMQYEKKGSIMDGLNTTIVKGLYLPLPNLEEQQVIADYLDGRCSKIDAIIAEAKASIDEYKELKQAVIYEAVTKGLDKNVEMKDSGVEWIGKMPKHWNSSRIKNECKNFDSLREPISAENRISILGTYDYYGASGVIDKIDDYNVDDTVLLIGEDGANLRMRNLPLVYKASGKFWVNNHAHILKVNNDNDYDYMAYLLEAGDYNLYITGTAQPKLSQFNLMRFPIVMPPTQEQQEISAYLNEQIPQIESLIAEKQSLIEDLEAYKKSLIYEVITGKRKVVA